MSLRPTFNSRAQADADRRFAQTVAQRGHGAGFLDRRPARARDALDHAGDILDRIHDPGIVPALAASLRDRLLAPARRPVAFGQELSEREVAVLGLLAAGLSQREIATQLYISQNTVKTHVRATYRKLGAATRTQALRRARDLGVALPGQPPGPALSPG